jgi:magnesium-transporting ATPase (P-type)
VDENALENTILNHKNLLLRGTKLKNVEWVLGVVVYAGVDSKIMKNAD